MRGRPARFLAPPSALLPSSCHALAPPSCPCRCCPATQPTATAPSWTTLCPPTTWRQALGLEGACFAAGCGAARVGITNLRPCASWPIRSRCLSLHCRPPQPYDMLGVVQQVVDDGQVFEIAPDYAKNIITGAPACCFCLHCCFHGELPQTVVCWRPGTSPAWWASAPNRRDVAPARKPSQTALRCRPHPRCRPPLLPQLARQALLGWTAARWGWWPTSLRCWPAASTSTPRSRWACRQRRAGWVAVLEALVLVGQQH